MDTRDKVFDFIIAYKVEHQGNTPTICEIQKGCGLSSTSLVHYHLEHLVDAGRITRTGASGRNIEIPGAGWELRGET